MNKNNKYLINNLSQDMLNNSTIIECGPNVVVWRESDFDRFFYIILNGDVKLTHEDQDDDSLIIDIYHSGDFFGEMQIVGLRTQDRKVTTLKNTKLLRLSADEFWFYWKNETEFSKIVFTTICRRLLEAGDEKAFTERSFLRHKVLRIIQNNMNEFGYFRYNKDILRELCGVSMRSLNRALKELEEYCFISCQSGSIKLISKNDGQMS